MGFYQLIKADCVLLWTEIENEQAKAINEAIKPKASMT